MEKNKASTYTRVFDQQYLDAVECVFSRLNLCHQRIGLAGIVGGLMSGYLYDRVGVMNLFLLAPSPEKQGLQIPSSS